MDLISLGLNTRQHACLVLCGTEVQLNKQWRLTYDKRWAVYDEGMKSLERR